MLLLFGALVGIPVAAVAYYYLKLVTQGQKYFFATLPSELGFHGAPVWWPLPMLALCGLIVGVTLRYLPGTGGHNPADGFAMGGDFTAKDLPSVLVASLATLSLGGVLGPEMPLVVIGMVLAASIVRLIKKDAPKQAIVIIGAAGSFAAISTLLGSPVVGAFLLLEAAGIGGGLISVILLPGLVAAGVARLSSLPSVMRPVRASRRWRCRVSRPSAFRRGPVRLGDRHRPAGGSRRHRHPAPGLSDPAFRRPPQGARDSGGRPGRRRSGCSVRGADRKSSHFVLFSGQSGLAPLIQHAATWSVGALVLLIVCKGLAFGVSMGSFKGGPAFPGMFLGAAIGIALSHLPGLPLVDGVAMGIGAMAVVAVGGLPLSSVVLTLVFIQSDAFEVIAVVIIAVAVAFVASAWLERWLKPASTSISTST